MTRRRARKGTVRLPLAPYERRPLRRFLPMAAALGLFVAALLMVAMVPAFGETVGAWLGR